MTYREVVSSSYGVGLALVIVGMVASAYQGLAYAGDNPSFPAAGMLLSAVGLLLMLSSRES